jgi:hypothetical protein
MWNFSWCESFTHIFLLSLSSLHHDIVAPQVTMEIIANALLHKLKVELQASCDAALAAARTHLECGLAELARERTKGIAGVAEERADLHWEIAAMQKQQEAQQGRVVLDIGRYRYTTSVQTLRRLPSTFFDAYFSGRYTLDRSEDGSIFIDRDGCWNIYATAWCRRLSGMRPSRMLASCGG